MESLIKKTGHNLVLPFYHLVTNYKPAHIKNLYPPRSVEQFKGDLDFLMDHYESISLKQLIELNRNGKSVDKNYFHLTFDDGLSQFYSVVAPILKEKKIHATVFLNSDFIDNEALFYRFKASILYDKLKDNALLQMSFEDNQKLDVLAVQHGINFNDYLAKEKPYLTSEQIVELIEQGITFGAHSKNHPLYKELSMEDQLVQTKESIKAVTEKFNLDYKAFSFPFTDDGVSLEFFKEMANEVDITFGSAGLKEDETQNNFQRIAMEIDKSGKEIIKAEYLYYSMKEKLGKHKIIRR